MVLIHLGSKIHLHLHVTLKSFGKHLTYNTVSACSLQLEHLCACYRKYVFLYSSHRDVTGLTAVQRLLLFGDHPSALWQALKYLQPQDQFANRVHLALLSSHSGHLPLSSIFQKGVHGATEASSLWPRIWMGRESHIWDTKLMRWWKRRSFKTRNRLVNVRSRCIYHLWLRLTWWWIFKVQYPMCVIFWAGIWR